MIYEINGEDFSTMTQEEVLEELIDKGEVEKGSSAELECGVDFCVTEPDETQKTFTENELAQILFPSVCRWAREDGYGEDVLLCFE